MFCRGTSSESNRCRPNYWTGTKRSKNLKRTEQNTKLK
jgi:hypothetical protein